MDARAILEVIADYIEARNGQDDFDESGQGTDDSSQEQRLNELAKTFGSLISK